MPRENSKCRKWEKERRDRLNEGFSNLAKVLESYDPSINICKINILHRATSSIQELQERIKHLLSSDTEKTNEKENIIKKLQDRVKKLLVRNEQLSNLLRDAGISVPSVCGTIKKFKKTLWSRRITPEQAEKFRKNEMERLNSSKPLVTKTKSKSVKTIVGPSLGPGTLLFGNGLTVPVLPQPQPILTNSTNLILNPTFYTVPRVTQTQEVNNCSNKVEVTKSKVQITSTPTKTLPFIRPKYCLTKTTQVNKVPIPALTSPYANSYCLFNDTKSSSNEKKEAVKSKKSNNKVSSDVGVCAKNDTKKVVKRKNDVEKEGNVKRTKKDLDHGQSNSEICAKDVGVGSAITEPTTLGDSSEISATTLKSNEAENIIEKVVADKPNICDSNKIPQTVQPQSTDLKPKNSFNVSEEKLDSGTCENKEDSSKGSQSTVTSSSVTTTLTVPASHDIKNLEISLPHSELSNDIFASLQVPAACQNPESTSPTAAFLLAFPLVSSGVKVTEVIDGDNSESHSVTPTLLQIGTMDNTKPTQSQSDIITSNFLNLDSFSFFSKDICAGFESNYPAVGNSQTQASTTVNHTAKVDATSNSSVYVNVKSPCLPTSVAEPIKQNCDLFCKKTVDTSNSINKEVKNYERSNSNKKFNDNSILYNAQIQPNSKADLNCLPPKVDSVHKNFEAKSQYHIPTTYPNSVCDLNYRPDLIKTCVASTCSYTNVNRDYTNPLYTNCNNYNYNYHPDTNFNQSYYKNIPQSESKSYYPLNYESYPDYRKNDNNLTGKYYNAPTYTKEKKNANVVRAKATTESKQPINWMTTPDNRLHNSEALLTPFCKPNFSQTYPFSSYVTSSSSYFATSTMDSSNNTNCALEAKKCIDLPIVSLNSHQRLDVEDKQFSWSPTKLPHFLDPPHTFVTSTLPTLVGDLALGNTLPFTEQRNEYKPVKENKDFRQVSKTLNYENQSNFLSVSQLVDHGKTESVPAKTSSRRNSGSRSKANNVQQKPKRVIKQDCKDLLPHCGVNNENMRTVNNYNPFSNIDTFTKSSHKNASSSYSAEALIGNQVPDDLNKRYQSSSNKALGASSFLAENIISCFPPVDLPQENFIPQNQNYQTNNFTHTCFQNNTYSSNSFIYTAPSYLGTNNFDPSSYDYLPDGGINPMPNLSAKDDKHYSSAKNCNKQVNKEEKSNHHSNCHNNNANTNNMKKAKRKLASETNTALFDFPFLPIPGTNNSPILPDDFHSHTNFLAPTTPFSCKNSLYPKQGNDISATALLPLPPVCRGNIQHSEISPSINTVGTSLTNFNLSTIFPEINKGPVSDMYQDTRIKDHLHHKTYGPTTPQVPFNPEPKFNFST
ncbi:hypothetical protein NQ315_012004 [Exocentrus adspersus]|uniref:BHLH domain-containing protein n=1 Tax=Exocentrus adspersus TaxID=1586481 RepID=A0AAV8W0Y6_9CUCU|nr:hypothetical protein NQ315_012004 [Exocentrus adspersus]